MGEEFVDLHGVRGYEIHSFDRPFSPFFRTERLSVRKSVKFLEDAVGFFMIHGRLTYVLHIEAVRLLLRETSFLDIGFQIQLDVSAVQESEAGYLVSLFFEFRVVDDGDGLEVRKVGSVEF